MADVLAEVTEHAYQCDGCGREGYGMRVGARWWAPPNGWFIPHIDVHSMMACSPRCLIKVEEQAEILRKAGFG